MFFPLEDGADLPALFLLEQRLFDQYQTGKQYEVYRCYYDLLQVLVQQEELKYELVMALSGGCMMLTE